MPGGAAGNGRADSVHIFHSVLPVLPLQVRECSNYFHCCCPLTWRYCLYMALVVCAFHVCAEIIKRQLQR